MSYDEYIKDLDYEDLCNLIARCEKKKATIEEQGKIPIYIVSCDCLNHFTSTDETVAKEWLKSVIKLLAEEGRFEQIKELGISKRMIWESELVGWSKGFNEPPEDYVDLS